MLIDNLLLRLCPNGVSFMRLSKIAKTIRGITYPKTAETDDKAGYPLLRGNNITLENNVINFDNIIYLKKDFKIRDNQKLHKDDILISTASGSAKHVGKVAFVAEDLDYYFGGFMAVIRNEPTVTSRYLFHNLTSTRFKNYLSNALNTTTINNLSSTILDNFVLPIPPLPVQEEIVRVLDKFTLLKAELEARTMQYEHYRDALLDFSNSLTTVQPTILENLLNKFGEANQMLLDELVSHNLGGGTPSKAISSYWGGEIPWASVKDIVGKGMFIDETKDSITEKGLKNSSSNLIPSGWLIICTRINPGVCAISTKDVAINQDLRALKLHDFVNTKFLWHYLQTIRIIGKGTTVKGISVDELGRIPVPVPPLPVQEAIVDILDRFEAIVHDIQDGLPAEIDLRQKQYEYYRDKLLTFEPLETQAEAA